MRALSFSKFCSHLWVVVLVVFLPCTPVLAGGDVPAQTAEDISEPTQDASSTSAEEKSASTEKSSGLFDQYFNSFVLEPSLTTYFVKGDRGRFRQDWWTDDQTTGGVRNLTFSGQKGDDRYEYEGHALVNYDYLSRIRLEKKDGTYAEAQWKQFRKYWDGSSGQRPWNPLDYALPAEFGDWDDDELHTDRGNTDVEVGLPISDNAKLITEYHLWTRRGRETFLRGEQAARGGRTSLRSIAMRGRVKGISNTVVLRMPLVIRKIHHVEPLVSYEAYRDSQFIDSARYLNGALNQRRDYIDKYSFDDLKAQLTYSSYLNDEVYVHSGYFFNFLRNDSVRSETRPNTANRNTFAFPKTDNFRVSNAFNLGSLLLDFLKRKQLDLRMGFRGEYAVTDASSSLLSGGSAPRRADSDLKEGWFGEVLSLTYRGLRNTTLYAGLDMEQRRLKWRDTYDARSHEVITVFGGTNLFPRYETDITYIDFVPKFKFTHRLNSYLKLFTEYRWQQKDRYYRTQEDSNLANYPGFSGSQSIRVHQVTSKLDVKLPQAWLATLKYQMMTNDISFARIDDHQQNWDRQHISTALSGPVGRKIFWYLMGAYEYNRVNTPTEGALGNRWGKGSEPYDFNGDYFLIANNVNYHLFNNLTLFLSYQITDSLGSNRNLLNEGLLGFQFDINDTTSLEARYQVFNFRDDRSLGEIDDDYQGHGMSFAFKKTFG